MITSQRNETANEIVVVHTCIFSMNSKYARHGEIQLRGKPRLIISVRIEQTPSENRNV